jgi:FkbM family methyltransferase
MNIIKQCKYGQMSFIHNDIWIGRSLDVYGEWAEGELELLKTLIKPGDTVLDVGANVGTHTLAFSQFVGNGIVHSFEPVRLLYYMLCGNVSMNNLENVICHQKVVSKESGTLLVPELDLTGDNFGGTVLHDYPNRNAKVKFKETKQEVPVIRIDDLKLEGCRLIKADVEGMEIDVLKGALNTIERFQPYLYLEHDPYWFDIQGCYDLVLSLGYTIEKHEPHHFRADNYSRYPTDVFAGNLSRNILCKPK